MSEPIRILQVVTTMNRGGLESMIMNYYRNVDRSKVQFDFLVHRKERSAFEDEIEALGGRIYRLPRLVPFSVFYRRALNRFFKEHKEYKIVHVHQDALSSIALKSAYKNGVPVRIAHSHTSYQVKNLRYIFKWFYKKFIPKYATDLFSCGEMAGKYMFGKAEFNMLNNAINSKEYLFNSTTRNTIRRELNLENDFVVGLVGNFTVPKNHGFLLKVFSELLKIIPNSKLLLLGEGELKENAVSKAEELGVVDNVIFAGRKDNVYDYLQAIDVFVMPSLYEGLPVSIVEAQAAGLPCFISDRVPDDCKITQLVRTISLDKSPDFWANEISKGKDLPRNDMGDEIVQSGFDIKSNAKYLQNYYLVKQSHFTGVNV